MSKITVTTIAGQTSGSDANKVKIESGDQLGIGTTPTHPLTVNGQIKSIGSNGETLQLQTSNQFSGVSFVGSDGTRDAIIDYDHTGGFMTLKAHTSSHNIRFTTGGYTERFRITDNGVTFNGDTAAANALDDYEEGTWTPTYTASGGGTITTTTNQGYYTKIGKLCFCHFHLRSSGVSGISGDIRISGFPFPATASGRTSRAGGQRFYARSWGADMPEFHFGVVSNNTYAQLYRHAMNASAASVTTSQFSTGGDNNVIEASITYEVDG